MPAAISVSNLLFEYPGHRALDQVSLDIESGSVTALVGPNGAGKTTLMRCIAGLEEPITGAIQVAGVDVRESPRESHRKMGYLSDFYGLYDALTVSQNLAYAAAAQGIAADQVPAVVRDTAERLNLVEKLEERAGSLSRGQRQRVAIGQAIVHRPSVLLLDEPASGLDPEARHGLAGLFRHLQGEGMTLLVSSHILAELDEYSTHMLVIGNGRVIEHRAIASSQAAAMSTVDVRVQCIVPADWSAVLANIRNVTLKEDSGVSALLEIEGDAAAHAAVLAELVRAGVAVIAFAPERQNLQDAYLRTLASARTPQAGRPS